MNAIARCGFITIDGFCAWRKVHLSLLVLYFFIVNGRSSDLLSLETIIIIITSGKFTRKLVLLRFSEAKLDLEYN